MPENVVRLYPSPAPAQVVGEATLPGPTREYILDMVEQLAKLAKGCGDSLLAAKLEDVARRQHPARAHNAASQSSSGGAPG